jgi:hypothetical protein
VKPVRKRRIESGLWIACIPAPSISPSGAYIAAIESPAMSRTNPE